MTKKHEEEWSWQKLLEHAREALANWEKFKDSDMVKNWLATRPPQIRDMALSHPDYQVYRMKPGAPYVGTHPGCIGIVISYSEDAEGQKGWFAIKFGMLRAAEDGEYLPIYAHVDPQWLEPVPMEEVETNAKLEADGFDVRSAKEMN